MNRVEKQLDRIIAGLKLNDKLKNLKFVREYGSHSAPTPIKGLVAVVSVTDMQTSSYIGDNLSSSIKGDQFCAKAQIAVYAPATENGSGLSEVVSELMQGLKKADAEKIITKTSATSIKFDADMNAIFRTVEIELEFCLCREVL